MKIGILGAGSWATAIAYLLSEKNHIVVMWSHRREAAEKLSLTRENEQYLPGVKLPENISFTYEIEKSADAGLIVMAVPSHAVRETAKKLKPFYNGCPVLNIAKGIEQKTLFRMSEVLGEELPNAPVAVMSGPSHAEEVGKRMPTTNIVSCNDEALAKLIQREVMTPNFRIYTNTDMVGVELGGSLKNVIALCAGITDGLGFGDNTKAALMTRGIAEIARLGLAMGAKRETFAGLSGIGDLIVTCTSMHSRNRRAGILIGQGKTVDEALGEVRMVVEGVKTADAACALADKYGVDMPICREAYKILFEGKSARDAVYDLMIREEKSEGE